MENRDILLIATALLGVIAYKLLQENKKVAGDNAQSKVASVQKRIPAPLPVPGSIGILPENRGILALTPKNPETHEERMARLKRSRPSSDFIIINGKEKYVGPIG